MTRYRRSIFAVRDIKPGEVLTAENIRVIRPGQGLPPSMFRSVLGRRAAARIPRGTPLSTELLAEDEGEESRR